MIFNPLYFSETGNSQMLMAKPNKLTNNKYLFSDIVKVIMNTDREQNKIMETDLEQIIKSNLPTIGNLENSPKEIKFKELSESDNEKAKLDLADILPPEIAQLLINDKAQLSEDKAISYISKEPLEGELQVFINSLVGKEVLTENITNETGLFLHLEDSKSAVNIELNKEVDPKLISDKVIVQTLVVPQKSKLLSLFNNTENKEDLVSINKGIGTTNNLLNNFNIGAQSEEETIVKPTLSVYSFKNGGGLNSGIVNNNPNNIKLELVNSNLLASSEKNNFSLKVPLEKISFIPSELKGQTLASKTNEPLSGKKASENLITIEPKNATAENDFSISKITIIKKQDNPLFTSKIKPELEDKRIDSALRKMSFSEDIKVQKNDLQLIKTKLMSNDEAPRISKENLHLIKMSGKADVKPLIKTNSVNDSQSFTKTVNVNETPNKESIKSNVISNVKFNLINTEKQTENNSSKPSILTNELKSNSLKQDPTTSSNINKESKKVITDTKTINLENTKLKTDSKIEIKSLDNSKGQVNTAKEDTKEKTVVQKSMFQELEKIQNIKSSLSNIRQTITVNEKINEPNIKIENEPKNISKSNNPQEAKVNLQDVELGRGEKLSSIKNQNVDSIKITPKVIVEESTEIKTKVQQAEIASKETVKVPELKGTQKEEIVNSTKTEKENVVIKKEEQSNSIKTNANSPAPEANQIKEKPHVINFAKSEQVELKNIKPENIDQKNITSEKEIIINSSEKITSEDAKVIYDKPIMKAVMTDAKSTEKTKIEKVEKSENNEVLKEVTVSNENKKVSVKVKGGVKTITNSTDINNEIKIAKSGESLSNSDENNSDESLKKSNIPIMNSTEKTIHTINHEQNFGNIIKDEVKKEIEISKKASFDNEIGKDQKFVRASDVIKELSRFITKQEKGSLSFDIKPENLGKMKITLDTVDNVIKASIEVESEHAKHLVERNINKLHQELQSNGIQLNSLNISLGQPKNQGSTKQMNESSKSKKSNYEQEDVEVKEEKKKTLGYNTYEYIA